MRCGGEPAARSIGPCTCLRPPRRGRSKLFPTFVLVSGPASPATGQGVRPKSDPCLRSRGSDRGLMCLSDARIGSWKVLYNPSSRKGHTRLRAYSGMSGLETVLSDSCQRLGVSIAFPAVTGYLQIILPYLGWVIVMLSWWAQISYHWSLYNTHR